MNNSPKTSAIQNEKEKTESFIMLPTVDFCFKELMCSEKVRKGLIAAFLLHVLELPKLAGQEEPENELLQWAKFLNGKREEDFREMAEKNEYINEAYQIIKHISEDEQKRYEYESREKAIRDHNHILYMAKKEVQEAKEKAEADIKRAKEEFEVDIKRANEEREKALAKGLKEGMETGLEVFIQYNLEQGILQEQILENLQKRFNLTFDLAEIYYEKYK